MDELEQLKIMAGIGNQAKLQEYDSHGNNTSNTTITAADKIKHQQENNIKPGEPAWFRLWFAKPDLTGELPH